MNEKLHLKFCKVISEEDIKKEIDESSSNTDQTGVYTGGRKSSGKSFLKYKKVFKCEFCELSLSSKHAYQRHVISFHPGKEIFRCSICKSNARFARDLPDDKALELHNIVYHGELDSKDPTNRVICPFCKTSYAKSQISEHIKSEHYGKKNYMCEQCPKTFRTKSLLEKHIELRHLKSRIYECKECDSLKFQSYTTYQTHRRNVHNPRVYVCNICGKTFKSNAMLNMHMTSHNEKSIFCDICQSSFKTQKNMENHREVHMERKFKCTVEGCNKKFAREKDVRVHFKISHTVKENHACEFCPKKFRIPSTLKRHIQVDI